MPEYKRWFPLAAPTWDQLTVTVCFDCRVDNRLFALDVAPRVRRHDVLVLAGLSTDSDVHVYHNDTPWPLPPDIWIQVQPADLLLILPRDHGYFITTHLADMLQDPTGWDCSAPHFGRFSPLAGGEETACHPGPALGPFLLRGRRRLPVSEIGRLLQVVTPPLHWFPCSGKVQCSGCAGKLCGLVVACSEPSARFDSLRPLGALILDLTLRLGLYCPGVF